MHLHAYKNTQTYLNCTHTHVKTHAKMTQRYLNNYIGSGYIDKYKQWIYWDVIHTVRILYGMNSEGIC